MSSIPSSRIDVDSRYDRRSLKFSFINCELDAPNKEVIFYLKDGKLLRVNRCKELDDMQVGNTVRQLVLHIFKEVQAIDNDPSYGGIQVSRTSLSVDLVCDVNNKIANKIADIIAIDLFDGNIYVDVPDFEDDAELLLPAPIDVGIE